MVKKKQRKLKAKYNTFLLLPAHPPFLFYRNSHFKVCNFCGKVFISVFLSKELIPVFLVCGRTPHLRLLFIALRWWTALCPGSEALCFLVLDSSGAGNRLGLGRPSLGADQVPPALDDPEGEGMWPWHTWPALCALSLYPALMYSLCLIPSVAGRKRAFADYLLWVSNNCIYPLNLVSHWLGIEFQIENHWIFNDLLKCLQASHVGEEKMKWCFISYL